MSTDLYTCDLLNICKRLRPKKNIQRVVLNQVYSFTPLLLNITWCQKKSRYRRFKPPKLLNLDENLLEN